MKTLILIVALALTGCATKQFPQVGQVTDFEKTAMTCHDIDLEMAKVQGTQQAIDERAEFSGLDVLAFLGDWGIGNAMAKNNAESTVTKRMADLNNLRAQKNCAIATAGVAQ
jgi:hypothetical protein